MLIYLYNISWFSSLYFPQLEEKIRKSFVKKLLDIESEENYIGPAIKFMSDGKCSMDSTGYSDGGWPRESRVFNEIFMPCPCPPLETTITQWEVGLVAAGLGSTIAIHWIVVCVVRAQRCQSDLRQCLSSVLESLYRLLPVEEEKSNKTSSSPWRVQVEWSRLIKPLTGYRRQWVDSFNHFRSLISPPL